MYGTERQRLGHRLTVAINTHRRQRLNADPTLRKPGKRLAWILGSLPVTAVGTCTGFIVGTVNDEPETLIERMGYRTVTEFSYTGAGGWPFTVADG